MALAGYLTQKKSSFIKPIQTGVDKIKQAMKPTQPTQGASLSQDQQRTNTTNNLYDNVNAAPTKFTEYKPFEYSQANIEANPEYQAALATAKGNIQTGQNNTLAGLIANGQGNSSYSAGVVQQIANKEMANVSNNILPKIIQDAYNRHASEFGISNGVESQNYGAKQDQIGNQSGLASYLSGEDQRGIDNNYNEAQLTGDYVSPKNQKLYDALKSLKSQAEAPGITAAQRAILSSQADSIRGDLKANGVDISSLGSNVSSNNLKKLLSQRTLTGQNQDLANDNQTFNQGLQTKQFDLTNKQVMATLTGKMPDGTKTTQQQQLELENLWMVAQQTGTIPDELTSMYGIPKGTKTQDAYQFAQNLGLQQDQNDIGWAQEDRLGNSQNQTADTVSGATAGDLLTNGLKKVVGVDPLTGEQKFGVISDPATREKTFVEVWNNSGVAPGADTITMLTKAGYSAQEIAALKVQYPKAFNSGGK